MRIEQYKPSRIDAVPLYRQVTEEKFIHATALHPYTGKAAGFIISKNEQGKLVAHAPPWMFWYIKRFFAKYPNQCSEWFRLQQFINDNADRQADMT